MVQLGFEKYSDVRYFKLDIKQDTIAVYTAEHNVDDLAEMLGTFNSVKFDESLKQELLRYEAVMQFQLVDKEKRLFITKRYCYRGSIDDWICISDMDTLDAHIKKFVRHLGKDSFYELI